MSPDRTDPQLTAAPRAPAVPAACPEGSALLALREGRLPEADSRRVEQHLLTCRHCRHALYALGEPGALPGEGAALPAEDEVSTLRSKELRLVGWLAGALALAVGVVLVLSLDPGPPLPDYVLAEVSGGIERERAPEEPHGLAFGPESVVRIMVQPSEETRSAAPALSVYVAGEDGALRARPAVAPTASVGGLFRIDVPASSLFDGPPGWRVVHLVIGKDAERVGGLAGEHPARVKSQELRWLEVPVFWSPTEPH